jgi:hypothetical protein
MKDVTGDMGKTMPLKMYNKLDSYREIGIPEIISHLLQFDDHFMNGSFVPLHTTSLLYYFRRISDIQPDPSDPDQGFDSEIIPIESGYSIVSSFDDHAYHDSGLEDLCLYDYTRLFYKQRNLKGKKFSEYHPQYTTCS